METRRLDGLDELVEDLVMLHFVTLVLVVCALVAGLALARVITNWFADR